ncbi:hypothetical protein NDU88_004118 [Pleurodeles waltl]|uniref:Uncharacterized protein n=1 Tax=Pleurodeles waltl TaxID=8319 RepID=A0AAV7T885_PLEWA|nr:hypothetical protein NDU88_004118 [Pleurodeles waltl]
MKAGASNEAFLLFLCGRTRHGAQATLLPFLPGRYGEQAPRKVPACAPRVRLKARFTPGAQLQRARSLLPAFGALGALDGAQCAQETKNTLGLQR